MKVEVFSLCDFASADAGGKLNVIGIFDTIYAPNVPVTHGFCALALRVRFDHVEEGNKKLKLSFIDSDGKPVMQSIETVLPVRMAANGSSASAQLVSIMSQISFPNFGEYAIELAIDGRQEASTPLFVRQVSLPPHLQQEA